MINSRRKFIGNTAMALSAASMFPNISLGMGKSTRLEDQIVGHGDYRYKVKRDWAKIGLAQTSLLNCHEMVMDSKGRLLMIGDHTDNNILVFDKSGKLLDYWGTQYPGGHGLTIHDEGGEDVLYIADCGWFMDRNGAMQRQAGFVSKTDINGRLIFNLPDPHTIGVYKEDEPFMPTEIAVGPNGDIYVADGYGSDYIIQYDHKGQYKRHFGGHHNENATENLQNAHGIAIDYRGEKPVLVCTSRTENCFKYFTLEGEYIKTVELPGLYVCRPVFDDDNLYAGVCWSKTRDENKGWVRDTGFVTVMEGDRVVSNPGGSSPSYENGELQQMYRAETPIFNHGHDVCVDEDKNLYVCQWNAHHTPPIKLERI
ncbi:NHL repeat-containing protein [Echinicola strongylocentroti]|uniref:6-bladed beta-propeller n=1 Tax=Echinicola strongylocentroti TaxID=1795355 RepID=UPI001FE55384|nr:6-bladed beta-propeller [Echinicola strongylocentroti]